MMKKILLLIVVASFVSVSGYSQCTPDLAITKAGITPDSATNLPHAFVGVAYSAVMQVKVPTDTSVIIGGFTVPVTIDTIFLQSMTGFPPGSYAYACNPAPCYFLSGSNGCVSITGPAPTLSQVGMVYPLTAIVRTSGHLTGIGTRIGQMDTLRYYYIQVDNSSGVGMISGSKFVVTQNHPNPFNKSTLIEFYSPASGMISVSVSNMLGKAVSTKTFWVQQGNNKITLAAKDYQAGIYFYTITSDKQSVTKRMIVDNE